MRIQKSPGSLRRATGKGRRIRCVPGDYVTYCTAGGHGRQDAQDTDRRERRAGTASVPGLAPIFIISVADRLELVLEQIPVVAAVPVCSPGTLQRVSRPRGMNRLPHGHRQLPRASAALPVRSAPDHVLEGGLPATIGPASVIRPPVAHKPCLSSGDGVDDSINREIIDPDDRCLLSPRSAMTIEEARPQGEQARTIPPRALRFVAEHLGPCRQMRHTQHQVRGRVTEVAIATMPEYVNAHVVILQGDFLLCRCGEHLHVCHAPACRSAPLCMRHTQLMEATFVLQYPVGARVGDVEQRIQRFAILHRVGPDKLGLPSSRLGQRQIHPRQ